VFSALHRLAHYIKFVYVHLYIRLCLHLCFVCLVVYKYGMVGAELNAVLCNLSGCRMLVVVGGKLVILMAKVD